MESGEIRSEDEEGEVLTREEPTEERPRKPSEQGKKAGAAPRRKSGKKKKKKKKKRHVGLIVALIVLLVLVMGAAGAGTVFAYKVSQMDTVFPGVAVEGVDLSGMTREQMDEALLRIGHERYDGLSVTASLPLENSLTVTAEEAHLTYNADKAAETAWSYGRSGNMLENLITWAKAQYMGRNDFTWDQALEVSLDEDAIRAIVAEAAVDIDEQLLRSGIEVTDTEIRVTKGASGLTLDEDAVVAGFRDGLLSGAGEGFTYESQPDPDEKFDFQGLYDEMYAEKAEAVIYYAHDYDAEGNIIPAENQPDYVEYKKEIKPERIPEETRVIPELPEDLDFGDQPYVITRSVVGVTFDVAEAERLWDAAAYGDTVTVPLTVTKPETTTEDIEAMLFADVLSKNWTMQALRVRNDYYDEVRTSLAGSSTNRISNVKKACAILNGIMLMPGETFSYNAALGERTAENGWLPAPAYANGEVRQENGGGICQVSSTLYNAVLYSNLQVLKRECHQFHVGYLPWGLDATVSWGWPDFAFRNNQNYPIKIVAWVDEETNECCIRIVGTDVDHVYVVMRLSYAERADTSGTYVDADGNAKMVGMNAATWRRLYHDGEDYHTVAPFEEIYEAYSQYNYHSEDI